RVIVLESGQVALDGSCAQVFSQVERLESMGLRLPQAALLRNRLNRQGFHLPDSIYTIEALSKALTEKLNKR
ncbi:MAG: energy-coupling factor transporter ATPase, partial [Clostridia bacterium]|nr:energy-coupling factor transporter ATPase [Clostridia bacterium]